jgi:hypothetical protein
MMKQINNKLSNALADKFKHLTTVYNTDCAYDIGNIQPSMGHIVDMRWDISKPISLHRIIHRIMHREHFVYK